MSGPDELAGTAFRERLREQAEAGGIALDHTQLGHLERYFRLLCRWNRTINLTALPLAGFPDRTLNRLFIEPMQAAQLVEDASLLWFDLGSGGGSPAIPLKIVRPRLRLTMVESKARKAAFLTEVVRSLSLTATDILAIRIEELSRMTPASYVDLITVRAIRVEEDLLRTAAGLLRPGGRLLLFGSKVPHMLNRVDFLLLQQLRLAGSGSILQVLSRVA